MGQGIHPEVGAPAGWGHCDRCGRGLERSWAFTFKGRSGQARATVGREVAESTKCFRCAIGHPPMLRRSLAAAILVGSLLTVLNQGDSLVSGQWTNALFWKIPLTYCVPFCVATYGALTNSRK